MHIKGLENNVILCDSVSKRYSLCGVRIGAIVSKNKEVMNAVLRYSQARSEKFAQWLLEDFSYNGKTVMVAPMAGFYATPGKGKDEVRIAYVLKIEDLREALACLREALKVYPGRTI